MTRIAITAAPVELVLISDRQLHLLAKILDTDFEVHLETPGIVVASYLKDGPDIERYYVRTVQALIQKGLVRQRVHEDVTYFEAAADVIAALN